MTKGLRGRALFSSIVLAVLLTGVIATLNREGSQDAESEEAQRRAAEALVQLDDVQRRAIDMQNGLRGFQLTQRDNFLEPFRSSRRGFEAAAARLESLMSADAGTRAVARSIRAEGLSMAAEAFAYLTKPLDITNLVDTVERAAVHGHASRDLAP